MEGRRLRSFTEAGHIVRCKGKIYRLLILNLRALETLLLETPSLNTYLT